ncbi:F-box only protein 47 [Sparganum proliferum]
MKRSSCSARTSFKPFKLHKCASHQSGHDQSSSLILRLPNEILFHIFTFLEFCDLSNFAFTCRSNRMAVELYLSSSACTQLKFFRTPHPEATPTSSSEVKRKVKYYGKIGVLFRKIYCLTSLTLRVELLQEILFAHMCCPPEETKPPFQEKLPTCQYLFDQKPCTTGQLRCPSLFFFGQFLRSFLSGCSDSEYQRVFHSLVHSCFGQNFWLRLTNLICKKAGELPEEELTVRLFLRRVFLDPLGLPVTVRPTWSDLEEEQTISSPRSCPRSTCSTLHSVATSSSTSFMSPSSQVPERTFQRLSLIPHSEAVCNSSDPAFANVSTESVLRTIADESPKPLRSSSGLITSTPIVFSNSSLKINSPRPDLWGAANVLFNILRSYPFVHQARLLFILYGPVHKGKLMWNIMCENTAADVKQLSACFGELGCVFSNMWLSGMWSADDTVAVLNEVTAIPDGWLAENVACLLHAAGPQLSSLAVRCKASRGRVAELAVILTSLCLVQVKIKENLSGLLGLVGDAVSATSSAHRQGFLDALAYAFRGVIVDLYETDELGEDPPPSFS